MSFTYWMLPLLLSPDVSPAAPSDKRPFEDTEENVKRVKKV